ncbi:dynamin family protein [Burkholderia sp. AU19243]|uniref:dynamin family protein n=1 Tax=Burkholderia sp. AU19243 TaxID=2824810 RepID=UPI001BA03104|nr:dynamin family protein [Burkholderia sp. AU19243]MBR8143099.1 dynamin family protein [Burkholderia vietnamiensis]MBR8363824.1 dynamin family protein [Burkholderia sp. AU19243]
MTNRKAMLELLDDSRWEALGERHDPREPAGEAPGLVERLHAYRGQLSAERFVLPIAGIQGSGKSTLLNALAFDEPVLPIDADETTCVPVEIAWAAGQSPHARVYFADGRIETLSCTEDALRSVVHNEQNPGNVKQVTRVALTSNRELFRHGLVLVDLPGVGSLTQANRDTTQRYLAEAVGVIFMLRTVPPLTRSEAIFVRLQWASLRTAIFVQNRWNDESDDEALAGREHNAKVLGQIAGQAGIPFDEPPAIHVVNGFDALRGTLCRDAGLVESSGLAALDGELGRFGAGWAARVADTVATALAADAERLAAAIGDRLEETKLDRSAHAARMAEDARLHVERLQALDERATRMRDDADAFRRAVRQQLRAWANDKGAELRNRMRTKMRAGIVDGPRLSRALKDEQSDATDDIFNQVQEDALEMQERLRMDLDGLDAWSADMPDITFTVDKAEAKRFENLAARAGAAAGGVWAAVEAGALVGSLGGGPVGAVIGGAVGGLLGAMAGQWLGGKAREGVTELRARAVEPEVFAAIDRYVSETANALNRIVDEFVEHLDVLLERWRAAKSAAFEQERECSLSMMNMSADEKGRAADMLAADLDAVAVLRGKLAEVRA